MSDYYLTPKQNAEYESAVAKCKSLDAIDSRNGYMSPQNDSLAGHLRTCMLALDCGLRSNERAALWEAFVLMQLLHKRMKGAAS